MHDFIRYGVILSFFISCASLVLLIRRTFSYGRRRVHAASSGDVRRGVVYALGRGMMPWEKESAHKHLPTYLAGVFYHFGVFSGMFYLLSLIIPFVLPAYLLRVLRILVAVGVLCGVGLLIKRMTLRYMRAISCVDDYVSNALVTLFLGLVLLDSFLSSLRPILFLVTIVLFLYIPLGKIRHCFFFFYSRILFGQFYGRRGVLSQK
jgi:hypothetical protein